MRKQILAMFFFLNFHPLQVLFCQTFVDASQLGSRCPWRPGAEQETRSVVVPRSAGSVPLPGNKKLSWTFTKKNPRKQGRLIGFQDGYMEC